MVVKAVARRKGRPNFGPEPPPGQERQASPLQRHRQLRFEDDGMRCRGYTAGASFARAADERRAQGRLLLPLIEESSEVRPSSAFAQQEFHDAAHGLVVR